MSTMSIPVFHVPMETRHELMYMYVATVVVIYTYKCLVTIFMLGWRLKQQTNGNAVTVGGQKPTLDNSIDKDEID